MTNEVAIGHQLPNRNILFNALEEESDSILEVIKAFSIYREESWGEIEKARDDDARKKGYQKLDEGAQRLTVPLMQLVQHQIDAVTSDPYSEFYVHETDGPSPYLINKLLGGDDTVTDNLLSIMKVIAEKAIFSASTLIEKSPRLSLLTREYGQYWVASKAALAGRDLSSTSIELKDSIEMLGADASRGFLSGTGILLRFVDVLPTLIFEHGQEPTSNHLTTCLVEGKILPTLARYHGPSLFSFERIACGCELSCFDTRELNVRNGPHGKSVDDYNDLQKFWNSHWKDMRLDASRLALYKSPIGFDIGLSFKFADTIDPGYGFRVRDASPYRLRHGCPIIKSQDQNGNTKTLSRLITQICASPQIWTLLIQSSKDRVSKTNRSFLPSSLWRTNMNL